MYDTSKYQTLAKYQGFHLFFNPTGNILVAMRGRNPSARVLCGGKRGENEAVGSVIHCPSDEEPLVHSLAVKEVMEYTGFAMTTMANQ